MRPQFEEYSIILVITFFVCLVYSSVLLTFKNHRDRANYILGFYILMLGLQMLNFFFQSAYDFFIREFSLFSFYAYGPTIYYYVKKSSREELSLKDKILIVIPFLHLLLWYFFLKDNFDNKSFFTDLNDLPSSAYNLFLGIYALIILHKRSNNIVSIKRKWIGLTVISFLVMITFYIASQTLYLFNQIIMADILETAIFITLITFIYLHILWIIRSPDILSTNKFLRKRINEYDDEKYKDTPMPKKLGEQIIIDLNQFIVLEKNFKNSELSLSQISQQLGYTNKDISQALTTILRKSLKEYLNEERINHATELLRNNEEMRINEIMYSSGYNSKSVFHGNFKKIHKMTPSEFRSKISQ